MSLLVLLAGCAPPADLAPPVTGSSTLVAAGDGIHVYVLDDDEEAVRRFDTRERTSVAEPLGGAPGRIARVADRVWVTLPEDRGIAVFRENVFGLERTGTIETGAAPLGIVAREDGERLYVALTTGNLVQELDGEGEVLRSWPIEGQPSWLALRPDGESLYVGSAYGGLVTWIDLVDGVASPIDLPRPKGAGFGGDEAFAQRVTGDPSVSADGSLLAVPMLLVDNIGSQVATSETVMQYYASTDADLSRFNPIVALVPLEQDGAPNLAQTALGLTVGPRGMDQFVRSYLSSVVLAPGGEVALATMESSSSVIALSTHPTSVGSLAGVAVSVIDTGAAGPRGAAFLDEERVYFDAFLDRRVVWSDMEPLRGDLSRDFFSSREAEGFSTFPWAGLDEDLLLGRKLFYSADDSRMAAMGAGVSCSTCHPAGRNDGLAWSLENGPRQTPSLAGGIAATAPFTWANDVASVALEVRLTSQERMGGDRLGNPEALSVAAYIESVRAVDLPALGSEDEAIARGRALFERADVGCAACHSGELLTDNHTWPLYELDAVNTPSLRRVSATAPYLHDGRAATLREVLELSRDGSMGDTSMLSEAELDDLEAYLAAI